MSFGPDTRAFITQMRATYLHKRTVPRREFMTLLNLLDNQGEACLDHGGIGAPGQTQCPACWQELLTCRAHRKIPHDR